MPSRTAAARALTLALLGMLAGALSLGAAPRSVDVLAWSPGMPRADVEAQLATARLRPIRRGPSALLLEAPIFRNVFARQRALLEFDSEERLLGVTVHLEPSRDGAGEELLGLYEEMRELLLGRLGAPSWSREIGSLPPGQALRVLADGGLVRCLQWDERDDRDARSERSQGAGDAGVTGGVRIVRLGIPKTASSQRRVEIRLVGIALPTPDGFWGREF